MHNDRFGYPEPAGFDDDNPRRVRAKITPGRLLLLAFVVAFAALFGGMVQFGPSLLDDLAHDLAPLFEDHPQTVARRIRDNLRRKNFPQALRDCEKLAKTHPEAGYLLQATILGQMKDYPGSIAAYTKVLALHPDQHVALNDRAYNRALARIDLEEAYRDIEAAIGMAGNIPAYLDTRGYLHYLLGRPNEALVDINRAIGDPNEFDENRSALGEVYFHRGLIYQVLGNPAKAKKDFDLAQKLEFEIDGYPPPVIPYQPKSKDAAPVNDGSPATPQAAKS